MNKWMRIGLALALAIGVLAGMVLPPGRTAAQSPAGAAPQATRVPAGRLSACNGVVTNTLSTTQMKMCEEAEVMVRTEPVCPACPGGIHVVYVQVDKAFQAAWMDRESVASLRQLEQYRGQEIRIGVVHYNSTQVRRVLQMTEQLSRGYGPLNQPAAGHDPHGDFVGAAREALQMLDDAKREHERAGGNRNDKPCEFVIYFASTKSLFDEDEQNMLEAAQLIKSRGISLMVGCPESTADYCVTTKLMPDSSRHYTEYSDSGRLRNMVRDEMDELMDKAGLKAMSLWQTLPPGLAYVEGSASEAPKVSAMAGGGGTKLQWDWARLTRTQPHTVTFRVKPVEEGRWDVAGAVTLTDKENKVRELPLPTQGITVAGLCLDPTPTPPPPPTETPVPTDTPTPLPTDTPVPTATNTALPPTATPTRVPGPIYLPIIVREQCKDEYLHTDVVLVLDMSTSMNRAVGSGRSKLAATLDAASQFVDRMKLEPDPNGGFDQVAVAGFNGSSWTQQALTNDRAAVMAAIAALPDRQAEGTRLDLAFAEGRSAVTGPSHKPENKPVIVLLTDGLPNRVPVAEDGRMETTVLRAAAEAKAEARVYTIGIGLPTDIDATLLTDSASSPGDYYYTPDPEELARIYAQIATTFGCPQGRHDWSKPWPFRRPAGSTALERRGR